MLLPVPLTVAAPVSVRFSTFAASVKVTELCTRSVPPPEPRSSVAGIVDHIGVVARPADHGVGITATIKDVIACPTEHRVGTAATIKGVIAPPPVERVREISTNQVIGKIRPDKDLADGVVACPNTT